MLSKGISAMQHINFRRLSYHIRHQYLTANNAVVIVALLVAASWAWGSVEAMERNYRLQKEVDSKRLQLRLAELETQKKEKATVLTKLKSQEKTLSKEIAAKKKRDSQLKNQITAILRRIADEERKKVEAANKANAVDLHGTEVNIVIDASDLAVDIADVFVLHFHFTLKGSKFSDAGF